MSTAPPQLFTLEEFLQLPDPSNGRYELHHGELILVSPPRIIHVEIQERLLELLRPLSAGRGMVIKELAYVPRGEREFWIADVLFIQAERWAKRDREAQYFMGAPDLVFEVLSPSNSMAEIADKGRMCLENGSHFFITIDHRRRTVKVTNREFKTCTYHSGAKVPLEPVLPGTLSVDDIFEGM